ncbi:MAG: hypothetical protein HUK07_08325, partial [Bacteroidaceae bacterium]|nr:hypothetical protein [Bacteroidaceae bacterium]
MTIRFLKPVSLIFLYIIICVTRTYAAEIVVTATNDTSIADAIKQAREWRRLARMGHDEYKAKIADGIIIRLKAGNYNLTRPLFIRPEDTGTADSPTRIIGEDGAVISGGVQVVGWEKHEGNIYVAPTPTHNGRLVETRQLWANCKQAILAQSDPIGKMSRIVDFDKENRRIIIKQPAPLPPYMGGINPIWQAKQAPHMGGGGLSLFLCQRWAIAILRIKDIQDLGNGTCALTFHEPESELEFSHPWPQPVVDPPSAYTLQNAYEFLDEQDEWYQDGDKIYYYSENGAPQNVTIPALMTLLNIEGSEQTPVQHLTIENIRFENSAWLRPNLEGHVTLQAGFRMLDAYKLPIEGLYHKTTLENQAWIARAETAVAVKNCRNIAFKN